MSTSAARIIHRLAWAGLCFCFTAGSQAQERASVVRVLNPLLAATFDATCQDSPKVRELVNELERSDLIVHVVALPPVHRMRLEGALHFVVRAGGRRFVRISVNERLSPDRRAAALGHELQHAVEVARAISVLDQASFARFYRQAGRASPGREPWECYETEEAQRAGEQVFAEVRAAAAMGRSARAAVTQRARALPRERALGARPGHRAGRD